MTSYAESAYSEEEMKAAVKKAGYPSFKRCVAELSTQNYSLTEIAVKLGLNAQRFWAYYTTWCGENAEPLRLGDDQS